MKALQRYQMSKAEEAALKAEIARQVHETCHSTCQRYMRYKLTKLLEGKQRAKAIDEVGFHRDVRKAVEKRRERKIRYDNR